MLFFSRKLLTCSQTDAGCEPWMQIKPRTELNYSLSGVTALEIFLAQGKSKCVSSHPVCFSRQTLKRKEKEYEHEMERLAREKISTQQRLAELKNDLSQWMDVMEIDRVLRQTIQPEDDQVSTSTASGKHQVTSPRTVSSP